MFPEKESYLFFNLYSFFESAQPEDGDLGLKLRLKLKQLPFPQLQNFRKNNKTLGWKTPLNVEGVKKGAGGWENGLGKAGSTCAPSQTHTFPCIFLGQILIS